MMMQQILYHFIVVSTQGSLNKSCNFLRKKKWKKCKCYGSVFPCKAVWKSSLEDFISCHWQSKKIKCFIKKACLDSWCLFYGHYFYFISWDVMEVLYCRVNFQIDKLVPVKGWWKDRLLLWCHGQDLTSEKTHFNVALHTRSHLPEYQNEFFPAN